MHLKSINFFIINIINSELLKNALFMGFLLYMTNNNGVFCKLYLTQQKPKNVTFVMNIIN